MVMAREIGTAWWVYENYGGNRSEVHKSTCPKFKSRATEEEPGGKWHRPFETMPDAETIGRGLRNRVTLCPRCT